MSAALQVPVSTLNALRSASGQAAYLKDLHPKQSAFVRDKSRRKAAQCSRRAGKTRGIAAWMLDGLEKSPGQRSVYITLSRSRGRQILWDGALSQMRNEYDLPIKLVQRDGQLMVEHENGASLWIAGCDDRSQVEKFRGEKYYRVAIDEAQAFPEWLESLIQDALEPALLDLRGELLLAGTPGPISSGLFFEATTGLRPYAVHKWNLLDNPHLPYAEEFLEERRAELGGESPTFQREYLGLWVQDLSALVYPITATVNSWAPGQTDGADSTIEPYGLPDGEYTFGLGIDLGFGERSTAFVLGAVRRDSGKIYILKAYTRSRMVPTALAAHVKAIREKISEETGGSGLRVVVDEGALGKGYAEQMRVLGVGCEPAQKTEKRSYQEYVQGLILSGAVQVHFGECMELVEECRKLQFDPETGLEDERNRRHAADAMLYLVRTMLPRSDPKQNEPRPGSPEAIRAEVKAERERVIREREQREARRR
jgi:hypothetical protein